MYFVYLLCEFSIGDLMLPPFVRVRSAWFSLGIVAFWSCTSYIRDEERSYVSSWPSCGRRAWSVQSHLLRIVTSLSLCEIRCLSRLVLRYLVYCMLLALARTVGSTFFWDIDHFCYVLCLSAAHFIKNRKGRKKTNKQTNTREYRIIFRLKCYKKNLRTSNRKQQRQAVHTKKFPTEMIASSQPSLHSHTIHRIRVSTLNIKSLRGRIRLTWWVYQKNKKGVLVWFESVAAISVGR